MTHDNLEPEPVQFFPLPNTAESFVATLSGKRPRLLIGKQRFSQLRYIWQYAHKYLECRSIAIEPRYIDRDFIEDFSAFYARSASAYSNYCSRVHFFTLESDQIQGEIEATLSTATKSSEPDTPPPIRSNRLTDAYLGFVVLRPLQGSPVGRTILRPPRDRTAPGASRRRFPCIRRYDVHLLGLELAVDGLPFQEQDAGVSACATTALWSALQKMHDHERVQVATPSQISRLASQYSAPFGRPMPAPGLSVDQMCQSVRLLGLEPELLNVRSNYRLAKSVVHSAVNSGFPPVLILHEAPGGPANPWHAVCISGESLHDPANPVHATSPHPVSGCHLDSERVEGVYIHDDRFGPYLSGTIEAGGAGDDKPVLRYSVEHPGDGARKEERWFIEHVLIPMHHKVHTSFGAMHEIAYSVSRDISYLVSKLEQSIGSSAMPEAAEALPTCAILIEKGTTYLARRLARCRGNEFRFARAWSRAMMPRYCGVLNIRMSDGEFDVLMDSTGTTVNPRCIAVAPLQPAVQTFANIIAQWLAKDYECEYLS